MAIDGLRVSSACSFRVRLASSKGQDLDGLAQPHIIGQATAEAKFLEKLKPTKPFTLVHAQRSLKALGLLGRLDAFEGTELFAPGREIAIDRDALLLGDEHVQKESLVALKSNSVPLQLAKLGQPGHFFKPLIGEHRVCTVAERNPLLPFLQCLEQRG